MESVPAGFVRQKTYASGVQVAWTEEPSVDAAVASIAAAFDRSEVAQLLVFFVMGFSPILYPSSQQPGWLATVNGWLPFEHMATIVRAGLTTGMVTGIGRSYAIVAAWGVAGTALAARALLRRA